MRSVGCTCFIKTKGRQISFCTWVTNCLLRRCDVSTLDNIVAKRRFTSDSILRRIIARDARRYTVPRGCCHIVSHNIVQCTSDLGRFTISTVIITCVLSAQMRIYRVLFRTKTFRSAAVVIMYVSVTH